jgi:hypothetical protein
MAMHLDKINARRAALAYEFYGLTEEEIKLLDTHLIYIWLPDLVRHPGWCALRKQDRLGKRGGQRIYLLVHIRV